MSDFVFQSVPKRSIMADELKALRAVDSMNKDLMERNAERVAKFKESMGTKYVLHPANAPRKQMEQRVLR